MHFYSYKMGICIDINYAMGRPEDDEIFSFGPDGYESKDDIGNWEAESWFFRFFRGKN